jgi:hypothetical protein
MTLAIGASANRPAEPRLNFVVDEHLVVKALSSQGMGTFAKKEDVLGHHISAKLPLKADQKLEIERAFALARQSGLTGRVNYSFDPFAMRPDMGVAFPTTQYFTAEITPLEDANGPAGFFVKVNELRSFNPHDDRPEELGCR